MTGPVFGMINAQKGIWKLTQHFSIFGSMRQPENKNRVWEISVVNAVFTSPVVILHNSIKINYLIIYTVFPRIVSAPE